ncbi:MAG: S-layer homology domain-containing protein [Clostridia bacterium]|nr:S-layer homology domain-containing protein [Clostridia bacterium]
MKLKRMTAVFCILLCLLWVLPQGAFANSTSQISPKELDVLRLTNAERAKQGLEPLSFFPALQQATRIRAAEIEELFSHTRPNGTACYTALDEAGISYFSAAENIAAGYSSPAMAMNGWMNSAGHRTNILTPELRHLGVGNHYDSGSEYGDHWVQLFVGGCRTTAIEAEGTAPTFDAAGHLLSADSLLKITCDMHGASYLPLADADYTYSNGSITVSYNDFSATIPCSIGFSDVAADAWYADEVDYVFQHNLMNGVGEGRFDPGGTMTRAMVVTVLYRMNGSPAAGQSAGFSDVPAGEWYTDAVNWAAQTGVVNGIGNNQFDPNGLITREEFVTMMYRYAQTTGADTSTLQNLYTFADADQVADWSETAMRWSVAKGIIGGVSEGGRMWLKPAGLATRAEAAAILMRYTKTL